ncbi:MAG: NAD(P)-dependent oxidoreductase [Candidatus Marinimicrobia bacterium]|nr:NAD(P)-dependent oxidoreductase [Candidatus Neomarinimicrobiota bacterium]
MNIGFLHPGAMGISLAVSAQATGHSAHWVPGGRSDETRKRAEDHNLSESQSLGDMCELCDIIISVCPPHAAVDVAQQILAFSFKGIYADVNAISPEKAKSIHQLMNSRQIDFVDGGIIGGPAWKAESTWLYLAGEKAAEVSNCFQGGLLETELMGPEIGRASAIKMSFAAYTKGSTALLCAIMAAADEMGIRQELEKQWSRGGSDFAERTHNRLRRVTAKAWRFSGEMEEIAATMQDAGLPDGFHLAAADIYRRMTHFKNSEALPEISEVLKSLKSR